MSYSFYIMLRYGDVAAAPDIKLIMLMPGATYAIC